jgi:hypothetical protein
VQPNKIERTIVPIRSEGLGELWLLYSNGHSLTICSRIPLTFKKFEKKTIPPYGIILPFFQEIFSIFKRKMQD